jgi:hypothetical protein
MTYQDRAGPLVVMGDSALLELAILTAFGIILL